MAPGGMVDIHHLGVRAVNGEKIFIAFNQLKDAGGERFIMNVELEENGRSHQYGGVAVDAVVGHIALLREIRSRAVYLPARRVSLTFNLWRVSPPDGPRGSRR